MVNSLKTKLSSLNKTIIIGTIVTLLINVQASAVYQADTIPSLDVSKVQSLQKVVNVKKEKELFDYIKKVNPKVKDLDAAKMAVQFIKCKKEFPRVPTNHLVQLVKSESTFEKNPNHGLKGVIGCGGIYTKFWAEKLKEAGIIKNINDLRKPDVGVRATAFVFNELLEKNKHNLKRTLTAYKGVSSVGAKRADKVIAMVKQKTRRV